MYLVLLFVSISLISCSSKKETKESEEETTTEQSSSTFEITNSQFKNSKMLLGSLENKEFHEVIKAKGLMDIPPNNTANVSTYFAGNVKEIKLLAGEKVTKGQVLFTLENPNFVEIQQAYLEAKSQLLYLKTDYERQKNLANDNVTSQKNYLKAETDYMLTKVNYESLRKKLQLMNINPEAVSVTNLKTSLPILAPISGFVSEINMQKGSFLNTSDTALTIINTSHMHLELFVFEQDIMKISEEQPLTFKVQNGGDKEYKATVHLVNKFVDPEKRTFSIHCHLASETNLENFSPGMYVEAKIFNQSQSKLALPEDAVVDVDGSYFVLLRTKNKNGNYQFKKKEVHVGESNNGFISIENSADFSKTDTFLIKGAYNLIQ